MKARRYLAHGEKEGEREAIEAIAPFRLAVQKRDEKELACGIVL
jgi:hypothetical protein